MIIAYAVAEPDCMRVPMCPICGLSHIHGAGGYGNKGAHCCLVRRPSPFGYTLVPADEETLRKIEEAKKIRRPWRLEGYRSYWNLEDALIALEKLGSKKRWASDLVLRNPRMDAVYGGIQWEYPRCLVCQKGVREEGVCETCQALV
jgi:hypothetical protein